MQFTLDLLRRDLAQHDLLREILRAHHNCAAARARPQADDAGENGNNTSHVLAILRSTTPIKPSASSASAAAGIAPARICSVSTDATPRKINTPSPPPPITAAMTAVPILVTTAIRI